MEQVFVIFNAVVDWLKIPFEVYGYSITLWSVICWSLLASFVIWCICKIFNLGG